MSAQTKQYASLAIALAATLGVAAGIVAAILKFKMPKPPKGG